MESKILGVIGGLGPETSCAFTFNINNKVRSLTNRQPHIILENLPITAAAERNLIHGETGSEHKELLLKSIKRFEILNADLIVIPCNTVHIFIQELRSASKVPILSIIEECAEECARIGIVKVGLLASTKTINERLHTKELHTHGIETIIPNQNNQKKISRIIIKIIQNKVNEEDKIFISSIIEKFKNQGAEALILGCTDLHLLIKEEKSPIPCIDTCRVLEDKVVECIT